MALSDCSKCWDTPCTCGWEYKNYSPARMAILIANILQYRTKRQASDILKDAAVEIEIMNDWKDDTQIKT